MGTFPRVVGGQTRGNVGSQSRVVPNGPRMGLQNIDEALFSRHARFQSKAAANPKREEMRGRSSPRARDVAKSAARPQVQYGEFCNLSLLNSESGLPTEAQIVIEGPPPPFGLRWATFACIQERRLVARDGIEPPTLRFSVACSTN